jgi:prophage regulatory protein
MPRFLRLPDCIRLTGLSKSTIWRLERLGRFPKRRKISICAVGWPDHEVQEWLIETARYSRTDGSSK